MVCSNGCRPKLGLSGIHPDPEDKKSEVLSFSAVTINNLCDDNATACVLISEQFYNTKLSQSVHHILQYAL